MTDVSADLETEIRRLRIRIIGLSPHQLAEPGQGAADDSAAAMSRRTVIAEALAELSLIGSGGRTVPDLGDQSLADQVVVLIETGMASAVDLPGEERAERRASLLDAAVRLRRSLA